MASLRACGEADSPKPVIPSMGPSVPACPCRQGFVKEEAIQGLVLQGDEAWGWLVRRTVRPMLQGQWLTPKPESSSPDYVRCCSRARQAVISEIISSWVNPRLGCQAK